MLRHPFFTNSTIAISGYPICPYFVDPWSNGYCGERIILKWAKNVVLTSPNKKKKLNRFIMLRGMVQIYAKFQCSCSNWQNIGPQTEIIAHRVNGIDTTWGVQRRLKYWYSKWHIRIRCWHLDRQSREIVLRISWIIFDKTSFVNF